jgi:hypothetical protein
MNDKRFVARAGMTLGILLFGILFLSGRPADAAHADRLPAARADASCGWVGACYCCDDYCICP